VYLVLQKKINLACHFFLGSYDEKVVTPRYIKLITKTSVTSNRKSKRGLNKSKACEIKALNSSAEVTILHITVSYVVKHMKRRGFNVKNVNCWHTKRVQICPIQSRAY